MKIFNADGFVPRISKLSNSLMPFFFQVNSENTPL